MKGKPILHTLYKYQLNIYLTVDSVVKLSQKMNKIVLISVRDITQLILFKTIELKRVSIFFHEFLRINVELNLDLKLDL